MLFLTKINQFIIKMKKKTRHIIFLSRSLARVKIIVAIIDEATLIKKVLQQ